MPRTEHASRIASLLAAVAVAAALGWAYAPNFVHLAEIWNFDPSYTHGFFIIPIALGILWHRRDRLARVHPAPNPWGWALLAVPIGIRVILYERNEMWMEAATIPLVVACLTLAFGGWALLRWAAPAIAFLWFMLPLPASINMIMAGPLQRLATLGSTSILQALGLPVLAEGNVIYIGANQLEVEQACNGLSMLVTFVTLITATAILVERSPWDKLILLVSSVPIALVSNIVRIAITAWAYHQFGPGSVVFPGWTIKRLTHDPAGWAMMPIALALVWIELRLLDWLIVEDDAVERPSAPRMGIGGAVPALPYQVAPKSKR